MSFKTWLRDNIFRGSQGDKLYFFAWTGNECDPGFVVNLDCYDGLETAYCKCSPVSTVINRLASAMSNGKWWIVDAKDNDTSRENRKTNDVLAKPNPLQSWTEFVQQMDVYRCLYGETFIYANVPTGFASASDANALWVISPKYMEVKETGKLYFQTDMTDIVPQYVLTAGKEKYIFESWQVLHIKDTNQNLCFGPRDLRGESRLRPLYYEVRNIIQAQEAIYSLNRDRGAQGILSNEAKDAGGSIPLLQKDKDELQRDYLSAFGMGANQKKIIITGASMKWSQMSYSVKDLMLFEGIKSNIEDICDQYDYPFELLSNSKGTTFSNKSAAMTLLYQDTVVPFSKIYAEKFTEFFGLAGSKIIVDFSELPCMQENEKDKAGVLLARNQANQIAYQNGIITREEWRLNIGMDEMIYGQTLYAQDNGNQENKQKAG
jgi:HK97 family phage portal protein